MKNKMLAFSLMAALLSGGLMATKTCAAENAAEPAHGRLMQRVAEKLNLTADQRARIKSVFADEKETLAGLANGVHEARKDLRAAIRAGDANETAVRAASAKVAAADADLAVERMKLYGKIAPILTAAQRQQLAEMQQRADEKVDRALARLGGGLVD